MAIWIKWTDKQVKMWDEWVASRPAVIQEIIKKYNIRPDQVYRINDTPKRYVVHSLNEDGTLTVNFLTEHNQDYWMPFPEVSVFGVDPASLIETDYPFEVADGSLYENLDD